MYAFSCLIFFVIIIEINSGRNVAALLQNSESIQSNAIIFLDFMQLNRNICIKQRMNL